TRAGLLTGKQANARAVTGGETGDDGEAERPTEREPDGRWRRQQFVGLDELVLAHADAGVADRDDVAGVAVASLDGDARIRWREVRGVVHQFGEQMAEVDGGVAGHVDVVERGEVDASEVLDFADGRAYDVE